MVCSIVENLGLTADHNIHRNDYEPMEHFASCAVWKVVCKDQFVVLLKYQWLFYLLFQLQTTNHILKKNKWNYCFISQEVSWQLRHITY